MTGEPVIADTAPHCTVTIVNSRGLHARAAAKFVQTATGFDAAIGVTRNGQTVSGISIMGLMMLAASPGSEIHIAADGVDADAALAALKSLVEAGFDEED
ncbi:MAG: HPr family phosphocarrier protein [Rhodospirillales bacterium]|nr:HPr family phosphocarrier protein [Rhodospirillales bacterium]